MHVAATYDGSTMRLYINGVEENWTPGPAAIAASALSVGIGGQANGSRRFRGDMDDVRIYNQALTPTEIAALVASGPVKADLTVTKSDRSPRSIAACRRSPTTFRSPTSVRATSRRQQSPTSFPPS